MKTKKLWIWSMIFGLLATGIFYVLFLSNLKTEEPDQEEVKVEEAEKVEEPAVTASEEKKEEFKNEMLPISEGKRAMTVLVTDEQGIAGFLKPGSYVDVVARQDVPEDAKEGQHASATLVLQNVKLLAIGHAADTEEEVSRYQLVTVEVTPREGLSLGFVTGQALYLMLRKEGDTKMEKEHLHIHEDELHKGVFIK